jgi:hypothetical protein
VKFSLSMELEARLVAVLLALAGVAAVLYDGNGDPQRAKELLDAVMLAIGLFVGRGLQSPDLRV